MSPTIKAFIRFELREYPNSKKILTQILPHEIMAQRQLVWLLLVVQSIELELETLPEDMLKYIERAYFQRPKKDRAILCHELNLSERTVRRYEDALIKNIAINIGLIRR